MTDSKFGAFKPSSYRGLKALVIILGVALVLGFVALVVAIATRPGGIEAGKAYMLDIKVPKGATITDAKLQEQRLILRLKTPDGEEVILLDAKTGREVGHLRLKPNL